MARRWVLAMLLVTASCGPIGYVNAVTRRASDAVEVARGAEADKYAPYWWTRATEYLHKARENAAKADYQSANRYGRLATEAAKQAAIDAEAAKKDPSKRPIDATLAPAKPAEPAQPARDGPPAGEVVAPAKDTP